MKENKQKSVFSRLIERKEQEEKRKELNKHRENTESYHNLKCLKKKPRIYDIESFDVETCGGDRNDFYLMGYIDKYDVYHYTLDKKEAIKMLMRSKHRGTFIYATNLGFDFNSIAEGTDLINYSNIILRGNSYINVDIDGTYRKVRLLDSVNYGGLSVNAMGKILNLPKLDAPKFLGHKPKNKKELDELIEYNKRDCEITKKFMELLQRGLNELGGELKLTISSCAMDLFRRKFLEYDVYKESYILGYDINNNVYSSYYGGRTEVFSRGLINKDNSGNKEFWFYGDFNSLYPSVLLYDYPDPTSVRIEKGSDRSLLRFMGVSWVKIKIPYTKYPPLPFRNEEGKLLFPYGTLTGYYTHEEINYCVSLFGESCLLEIKDTIYYTKSKPYFTSYVNTLYELRQKYKKEDNQMQIVVKLLLNSLYGRFALRNVGKVRFVNFENKEESIKAIDYCDMHGYKLKCDSANTGYFVEKEAFDGISSIPIWSSYCTSYARIKLHKAILQYNPVYVDTDSVITRKEVIDSNKLGELKLEKTIKEGIIIKPKLYFIDNEIKCKGVPIPKTESEREILKKKILNGEFIKYKKFVKIKEAITRNIKVNSIIVMEKRINLNDDKRSWRNNFGEVLFEDSEPLRVGE